MKENETIYILSFFFFEVYIRGRQICQHGFDVYIHNKTLNLSLIGSIWDHRLSYGI